MADLWIVLDACTSSAVLKIILFVETLLKYVCYIIPMGLIVMVSLDFAKNVMSMKDDEFQKNLKLAIKRIIFAVGFFLVPILAKFSINLVSNSAIGEYESCLQNTQYISYYEELEKMQKQLDLEEEERWFASIDADAKFKKSVLQLSMANGSKDGTFMGQTYKLSDAQLEYLASVAQGEQFSSAGAAAEVSLMANRFELYGSSYGTGADGLYNYVKNSGWWSSNSNRGKPNQVIIDTTKSVLMLGQRTLPLYVDEHDCIYCGENYGYDIVSAVNNGKTIDRTDRSQYKKDVTVLTNRYGAVYTFYTFPSEGSDPFGYTAEAKNKVSSSSSK